MIQCKLHVWKLESCYRELIYLYALYIEMNSHCILVEYILLDIPDQFETSWAPVIDENII